MTESPANAPVLVWTRMPEFRARLSRSLGPVMPLVFASNADQIEAELVRSRPRALVIDPELQRGDRADLIRIAYHRYPDLPVALTAPSTASRSFNFLKTYAAAAVIPPLSALSPRQIQILFSHFTSTKPTFGLETFFPGGQKIQSRRITDPAQRGEAFRALAESLCASGAVDTHDLQLVFEETLNNAIYHAFRDEQDQPKYAGGRNQPFDEGDEVLVEWACEKGFAALCVSDNQGCLAPGIVWDRFLRQTSMAGLLDTSGRGLYLTHLLARMVLITIAPGKRTQVTCFFISGTPSDEKPLSVRVVRNGNGP